MRRKAPTEGEDALSGPVEGLGQGRLSASRAIPGPFAKAFETDAVSGTEGGDCPSHSACPSLRQLFIVV